MLPRKILFLCVANSARSQMAEALARSLFDADCLIQSAGSSPTRVNPFAVQVLQEEGLQVAGQASKSVEDIKPQDVEWVITLCEEEVCPVWLGKAHRLHWPIPDPDLKDPSLEEEVHLAAFRQARDTIRGKLEGFQQDWAKTDGAAS